MSNPELRTVGARIRVWDMPLRLFHWLLVAAIVVTFLSAEEESPLNDWHIMSGWAAAILIAFRVVWGFIGGENARFSKMFDSGRLGPHVGDMLRFKPQASFGHNPLGWISVVLLIVVSAVTIWTGALITAADSETAGEFHEIIGWGLLALVVVHILAVIIMSVLTRENLVRAMVTGSKPAERHPDCNNTRGPSFVACLIGLAAIVAAFFGVLSVDPQAFIPRSTETAEHGEYEMGDAERLEDRLL